MTEKPETSASRRAFLKLAGTAAPAAVAAVAVSGTEAEAAETPKSDGRMQDTAHTRAYLASTRF
ncbi:MAG: twin-arginine translocation signal domain-containing protein [Pelagibaca sp.]